MNLPVYVAQAVSLSEFYLNLILLILSASMQSLYLFCLLLCLFSKHLPEQLLKRLINSPLGNRPPGATNCNSMNAGGLAKSSGLVSGHVMNLTSFIFYLIYDAQNQFSDKRIILVAILFAFDAILVWARLTLGCHTKFQVCVGFGLGILWGYVIFKVMEYIESKSGRVALEHKTLSSLFN